MRKFQHVDVGACLRAVMEQNTRHYQSDFEYDKEKFLRAAQSNQAEDKILYWMSRPSGTWCFKERDVFIQGTEGFHTWQYYKDTTDNILAYTVEVTGLENGRVMGTLYPQDYREQAKHIEQSALPPATVTLRFEAEEQPMQLAFRDYHNRRNAIHHTFGRATSFRVDPESPDLLNAILLNERTSRGRSPVGVFDAHLKKLIATEKKSVLGKLKTAAEQAGPTPDRQPSAPAKGGTAR